MRHRNYTTLLAILFLITVGTQAWAERFEIRSGEESEIVFTSKALWEKFDGKTKDVSGFLDADLANLAGDVNLEVVVDLATFDTGMKKRNEHMRDNHLETDKFPHAYFRGGKVLEAEPASLAKGASGRLVLLGTLDLHGVQKEYQVTLELDRREDGALRVRGEFPVLLPDHEISRPQKLVVKLAEKQEVKIDLLAEPGPGGEKR